MKIFFLCFQIMAQTFDYAKPTINGSLSIGATVHDFSLKNINNEMVSLNHYTHAKGFIIVFTCNHCPFAKLYPQRLNDLHTKYNKLNVPLLAINSMDSLVYEDETFELMQQRAKAENYLFPYLQDPDQIVGKDFKASHTPQAFIIWKENNIWTLKYQGAIDDNGAEPEKATPYLSIAVDELLAGKPVSNAERKAFGCAIYYRN